MLEDRADIGSLKLDSMQPGVMLAAMVSSIDVYALSGYDRIIVLRAQQRMASHYAAQVHDAMTAVVDVIDADDPQWAQEAAAAEIAAALRLTRRAADTELSFALDLKQRLPQVWNALTAGRIDVRRARTIIRGTDHLSIANARDVVDRVMVDAAELTTGQLAARIRQVCMEADPVDAVRRYDEAVRERRIATEPTTSGTANLLGLDLPPHRLAAGMRHVNQLAVSLRTKHE